MIIPLSRPFKYEDVSLDELNLDFENSTGSLLHKADREYKRREKPTPEEFVYRAANSEYCLIVASFMLKVSVETLRELPIVDYQRMTMAVSYFLSNLAPPEMSFLIFQGQSDVSP